MPTATRGGKDVPQAHLTNGQPNPYEPERYALRVLPEHSAVQEEEYVLRAVLQYPECLPEVRAALDAADFYGDGHQRVYRAALAVADAGAPVDAVGVAKELERRGW